MSPSVDRVRAFADAQELQRDSSSRTGLDAGAETRRVEPESPCDGGQLAGAEREWAYDS
jgi:hypothetical protein